MACYLDLLGAAFAGMVLAYDPDIIVLCGGVSLTPGLIEKIPAAMKPHLFSGTDLPSVARARSGDASGARGAALIAEQQFAQNQY